MEKLQRKSYLSLFLIIGLFISIILPIQVVKAEETEVVNTKAILQIDANYYGGKGMTRVYTVGSEIDLTKTSVFIARDGYTRSTTLYKDSKCTKPIDEKFIIEEDTTLYVKWEKWTDRQLPIIHEYNNLMKEAKDIIARPHAFGDDKAFSEYTTFVDMVATNDSKGILAPVADIENLYKLRELRNNLTQLTENVDEDVLYIWGDYIASENSEYNFFQSYDKEDFKPFLVPYLAEDQENVKGNMIVISGGQFFKRANATEAYPTAEYFRQNGYNTFVLQYRVSPYTQKDAYLDLQRAIRYIKYYGEELEIAYPERISVTGFSAGGMTITGMLENLDANMTPSVYDNKYKSDEIDEIDSSIDAMLNIYGALTSAVELTKTDDLPEMFIAVGLKDTTLGFEGTLDLYKTVGNHTRAELHVFADAPHSIGLGNTDKYGTYTAYAQWPTLAKTFLDITYGYQDSHIE